MSTDHIQRLTQANRKLQEQLSEANAEIARVRLVRNDSAEDMRREIASLRDCLEQLLDNIDEPPDRNCSCHISPPCNDCVDNSSLREAIAYARAIIAREAQ